MCSMLNLEIDRGSMDAEVKVKGSLPIRNPYVTSRTEQKNLEEEGTSKSEV